MAFAQKRNPNKSSLFGAVGNISYPVSSPSSSGTPNMTATKSSSTPIILVGGPMSPPLSPKPSVPAKPKALQNLANVSRHSSINLPRSPTGAAPTGVRPAYSTGTMPHRQSQESIGSTKRMAPKPPVVRPKVAPPKPPISAKPPRSASNASISDFLQKSPNSVGAINQTLLLRSSAAPNPSSLHSIAAVRDDVRTSVTTPAPLKAMPRPTTAPIILSGGQLPPHRTMPAPPPPQRQTSNGGLTAPPKRYTSIHINNVEITPNNTPNNDGTTNAYPLVNDMETKFGKRFHNVTEFPKPPPFLNIQKVYSSRSG